MSVYDFGPFDEPLSIHFPSGGGSSLITEQFQWLGVFAQQKTGNFSSPPDIVANFTGLGQGITLINGPSFHGEQAPKTVRVNDLRDNSIVSAGHYANETEAISHDFDVQHIYTMGLIRYEKKTKQNSLLLPCSFLVARGLIDDTPDFTLIAATFTSLGKPTLSGVVGTLPILTPYGVVPGVFPGVMPVAPKASRLFDFYTPDAVSTTYNFKVNRATGAITLA